jgi:hypothetical protein
MVCLRNICINTLQKGYSDDDNNNSNNNSNGGMFGIEMDVEGILKLWAFFKFRHALLLF